MIINKFVVNYILNIFVKPQFLDNASIEEISLSRKIQETFQKHLNEEFLNFNFLCYLMDKLSAEDAEKILKNVKEEMTLDELVDKMSGEIPSLKGLYEDYFKKISCLFQETVEVPDEEITNEMKDFLKVLMKDIKSENAQIKILLTNFYFQISE